MDYSFVSVGDQGISFKLTILVVKVLANLREQKQSFSKKIIVWQRSREGWKGRGLELTLLVFIKDNICYLEGGGLRVLYHRVSIKLTTRTKIQEFQNFRGTSKSGKENKSCRHMHTHAHTCIYARM